MRAKISNVIRTLAMSLVIVVFALMPFMALIENGNYNSKDVELGSGSKADGEDVRIDTRAAQFTPILECDDDKTKYAYPYDLVLFNCTVKNGGNMVDDLKVEADYPRNWQVILYPDKFKRIPPMNSPAPEHEKIKSLRVQVVVGDIYNATVGTYHVDVTLRSLLSNNKSTLSFTVEVLLEHRLEITPPKPQYALPGEKVIYDFQVRNLGNGDDVYDVWVESSDYDWGVQLVDDTQELLEIGMGNTIVISVILYLPEQEEAGTAQITTLLARPHENEDAQESRGMVQTLVTHIWGIEVVEKSPALDGIPSGYTTLTFTIKNTGNDLDDVIGSAGTFVVSKSPEIPEGWESWFDTSDIRKGGLPKDLEADIELKIRIPPSTPVGKYDFHVDIYSGKPLKWMDGDILTVNVVSVFNAEMSFNVTRQEALIGTNVSFESEIHNIGNIRDTYIWEIDSAFIRWVYIPDKRFDVEFGNTYTLRFFIAIPKQTSAGEYEFKMILSSEGDKNISFVHNYILTVTKTLDFSFGRSNKTYDVIPEGETIVHVLVNNTGNADVTVSFEIRGEGWGLLAQKNLFLRYQETKELPIAFSPPKEVELKTFKFELVGQVTVGADVMRSTIITVRAVQFQFGVTDIYMIGEAGRGSYAVDKDQTVGFYADVMNKANQFFDSQKFGRELAVKVYRGKQQIHSENITHMEKNDYERISFNYTFNRDSVERFTIELGGIKDNEKRDDRGNVTVRVLGVENEANDVTDGIGGHTPADWIYAFLIVLFAIAMTVISTIVIQKKYNVDPLIYDAKGDYKFDEISFDEEGADLEDYADEESERTERDMGYLMELEQSGGQYGQQAHYGQQFQYGPAPGYGEAYYQEQQSGPYAAQTSPQPPMVPQQPQPLPHQPSQHSPSFPAPAQQRLALPPGSPPHADDERSAAQPPSPAAGTAAEAETTPASESTERKHPPAPKIVAAQPPPSSIQKALSQVEDPAEPKKRGSKIDKQVKAIQDILSHTKRAIPVGEDDSPEPPDKKGAPRVAKTAPVSPEGSKGGIKVAKTAPVSPEGSKASVKVAKTAPVSKDGGPPGPPQGQGKEKIGDTTKRLEDLVARLDGK